MHNLLLGCLLDMCENPKSVAHMLAWKGTNDRGAANLLVQIWREEETAIGVSRDDNGCIAGRLLSFLSCQNEKFRLKVLDFYILYVT